MKSRYYDHKGMWSQDHGLGKPLIVGLDYIISIVDITIFKCHGLLIFESSFDILPLRYENIIIL